MSVREIVLLGAWVFLAIGTVLVVVAFVAMRRTMRPWADDVGMGGCALLVISGIAFMGYGATGLSA